MTIKRKLPDMDMSPKPEPYRRPPGSVCEPLDYSPIAIEGEHLQQVHIKQWIYRQRVVDFSFTHTVTKDGAEHFVARIDCCNGSIHRHAYLADGTDVLDHQVIREIWNDEETWEIMQAQYDECWERMIDEAEMNYRRWSGGR